MQNFKDLVIWNQGIELAVKIYTLTRQLPKEETYGLTSQIKRAAVSIPSNIAEGCSRDTARDFCRFLRISLGSSFELETDFLIAERLRFISSADVNAIVNELQIEQRRINAFISKVSVGQTSNQQPETSNQRPVTRDQ